MTDGMIKRQEELVKKTNEYFVCVVNSIGDNNLKRNFLEQLKVDVEDALSKTNNVEINQPQNMSWSPRVLGKITLIKNWIQKNH